MSRSIVGAAVGAFLTGSIFIASQSHAAFSMVASAPVTSDGKTVVSVIVLNEESRPQTFHPAEVIKANSSDGPIDLKLVSPPVDQLLVPGQFLRVNYIASRVFSPQMTVSLDPITPAAIPVARAAIPTSTESTQPVASSDTLMAAPVKSLSERSLVETLGFRLKAHEPVYFLAGPSFPNAKFQFSMKYHLIGDDDDSPKNQQAKREGLPAIMSGLYLAYSQTSFWDLEGFSKPFFDSSYRPEIFYQFDGVEKNIEDWTGKKLSDNLSITLQTGLKHESNGKGDSPVTINRGDGDEIDLHPSRSMNIVYARAIFNYSFADDYILKIAPSIHAYVFGTDPENDNIADYRGYGDLKVVFGKQKGMQLAAIGRAGKDWDKGAVQLDLSFPISEFRVKDFDIYFHAQYFNGYGEILHDFDRRDSSLRIGISMVR